MVLENIKIDEFDDFVTCIYNGSKPTDWRIGQWAFNVLDHIRPQIANDVRGSIFDPFYKNFISTEFLEFVRKRW
jgi:hypothetical protein